MLVVAIASWEGFRIFSVLFQDHQLTLYHPSGETLEMLPVEAFHPEGLFFCALLVEGHPLLVNIFRPEEGSKHQLLILKRRLGWRLWQMFDASGFTNDCN